MSAKPKECCGNDPRYWGHRKWLEEIEMRVKGGHVPIMKIFECKNDYIEEQIMFLARYGKTTYDNNDNSNSYRC